MVREYACFCLIVIVTMTAICCILCCISLLYISLFMCLFFCQDPLENEMVHLKGFHPVNKLSTH